MDELRTEMMQIATGYWLSKALFCAAKADVADEVDLRIIEVDTLRVPGVARVLLSNVDLADGDVLQDRRLEAEPYESRRYGLDHRRCRRRTG